MEQQDGRTGVIGCGGNPPSSQGGTECMHGPQEGDDEGCTHPQSHLHAWTRPRTSMK
jgi:hypothetical protein